MSASVASASGAIRLENPRKHPWRCQDIRWRLVLQQHWGNLVAVIPPAVASVAIYFVPFPARVREFSLTDPAILGEGFGDTIPAAAAVIIPAIALILTLVVMECVLLRDYQSITIALATILHICIDAFTGFLFVIFICQFMNAYAGALRPSFLSRCNPDRSSATPWKLAFYTCTNPDTYWVNDGRKSFPSGHAASCLFFAMYSTIYILYRVYFSPRTKTLWARGCGPRCCQEFLHVLWLYWILAQIMFGWGVGMSRYLDNQHSLLDVTAGILVGVMFGLVLAVRCLAMLPGMVIVNDLRRMRAEELKLDQLAKEELELADAREGEAPVHAHTVKHVPGTHSAPVSGDVDEATGADYATTEKYATTSRADESFVYGDDSVSKTKDSSFRAMAG